MTMLGLMLIGLLAQDPAQATTPAPELPILHARLGDCSADFTVKDADGKPIYNATIVVRLRYGFMSVKRMDLEIGTNSDGNARVDTLPSKAKPMVYEITKGDLKTTVEQDLAKTCKGTYDVVLK